MSTKKVPPLVTIMFYDEADNYHVVTLQGWKAVIKYASPFVPPVKKRRRRARKLAKVFDLAEVRR
jgi:hypothetical protein